MAKKAKVKMGLPDGGSVILPYEIRIGSITGLYHLTAKSGTEFLYTEDEIRAKLIEGRDAAVEDQTIVDPADLIG